MQLPWAECPRRRRGESAQEFVGTRQDPHEKADNRPSTPIGTPTALGLIVVRSVHRPPSGRGPTTRTQLDPGRLIDGLICIGNHLHTGALGSALWNRRWYGDARRDERGRGPGRTAGPAGSVDRSGAPGHRSRDIGSTRPSVARSVPCGLRTLGAAPDGTGLSTVKRVPSQAEGQQHGDPSEDSDDRTRRQQRRPGRPRYRPPSLLPTVLGMSPRLLHRSTRRLGVGQPIAAATGRGHHQVAVVIGDPV
jgi:hypothetical protein